MKLWTSSAEYIDAYQGAWLITRDFNCVLFQEEKIGGIWFQPVNYFPVTTSSNLRVYLT